MQTTKNTRPVSRIVQIKYMPSGEVVTTPMFAMPHVAQRFMAQGVSATMYDQCPDTGNLAYVEYVTA